MVSLVSRLLYHLLHTQYLRDPLHPYRALYVVESSATIWGVGGWVDGWMMMDGKMVDFEGQCFHRDSPSDWGEACSQALDV